MHRHQAPKERCRRDCEVAALTRSRKFPASRRKQRASGPFHLKQSLPSCLFGLGGEGQGFGFAEEGVAEAAGFVEVFGPQRAADTLLGERSGMNHVVNEPRAVVVPEMVVRVFGISADAEFHLGVVGFVDRRHIKDSARAGGPHRSSPQAF